MSRIPFNDSEGTLKLLRNREYVGSSPTMGNWVTAHPESGRGSIPQGRCVRLAAQWFKLSFISLLHRAAHYVVVGVNPIGGLEIPTPETERRCCNARLDSSYMCGLT